MGCWRGKGCAGDVYLNGALLPFFSRARVFAVLYGFRLLELPDSIAQHFTHTMPSQSNKKFKMSPSILTLTLTLLLLLTTTQARQLAQKVSKRELEERATYNGGWALGIPGTSCPADAPVACAPNSGSVNPSCCPSGQTCFGSIDPHCCPGCMLNLPSCLFQFSFSPLHILPSPSPTLTQVNKTNPKQPHPQIA